MKKLHMLILLAALSVIVLFGGCAGARGGSAADGSGDDAGPARASTAEELEAMGYTFHSPAGAQDISYSVIEMGRAYKHDMGEARFSLDDTCFTLRILCTPFVEDISGTYYTWSSSDTCDVGKTIGETHYIDNKNGLVLWYDEAQSLLYCLYMDSAASNESLAHYAALVTAENASPAAGALSKGAFDLGGVTFVAIPYTQGRNYYTNDNTLLAECAYELFKIQPVCADGSAYTAEGANPRPLQSAEAFNDAMETYSKACMEQFEQLVELANEDYISGETAFEFGGEFHYYQNIQGSASWLGNLLSVTITDSAFTGGAHGNYGFSSWNFDLAAGVFITPDLLVEDMGAFIPAVADEIVRQAGSADMLEEYISYSPDGYYETLLGWPDGCVTFGESGMTVIFNPYELASFASGEQVFTIELDFLAPYLNDYGRGLLMPGT